MSDDPFPAMLTMEQVAAKLGKSKRWLYDHLKAHPCGRFVGRTRMFTEADYAALLNALPRDEPRSIPPFVGRAMAKAGFRGQRSTSAELDALLAKLPDHKPRGSSKSKAAAAFEARLARLPDHRPRGSSPRPRPPKG